MGYKRNAKVQASILGEGDVEDSEAYTWVICQTGHAKFGAEVNEGLLQNEATGLAFSERGVVIMEGEVRAAKEFHDSVGTGSGGSRAMASVWGWQTIFCCSYPS